MPLSNTVTFSFNNSSLFTANLPSYVATDSEAAQAAAGKRYANKSLDLNLVDTSYGYITFDVTYTGTADVAAITFSTPNGSPISVGTNLDDVFGIFLQGTPPNGYDVKLTSGQKKRIYVIVNGVDLKTNIISILTSIGATSSKVSNAVNSSIVCEYDCTVPLYPNRSVGLHVYSPYDAAYSPKLTTDIFSRVALGSWTSGTKIWQDAYFSFPAFPYYYGIGDNVYKVGGELDRSYGTKKKVRIVKTAGMNLLGRPAKTTETIVGPKKWPGSSLDSTNACVDVLVTNVGRLESIVSKSSLIQPQKYRYYMGYNVSSAETANNNTFQKFVYNQEKFYPITGQSHSVYKFAEGILVDINSDSGIKFGKQTLLAIGAGLPLFTGIFFKSIALAMKWATTCYHCYALAGNYLLSMSSVALISATFIGVAIALLIIALILWSYERLLKKVDVLIFYITIQLPHI
jgi:hypothetical protein